MLTTQMEHDTNKIVLLHWIGRLGNRMFQYAFGCSYAKKYNCIFYIPSTWEGTEIFVENEYCKIVTDDELRHHINQTFANEEYRKKHLLEYNKRTNDTIEIVSMENKLNFGKTNIAFHDLHCMYFVHCFEIMEPEFVKHLFQFNDVVRQSEMYAFFSNKKQTYDAVHLRRGDISQPNFSGHHSMISKQSYLNFIQKLRLNEKEIQWVSDNKHERTPNPWNVDSTEHAWSYPCGQKKIPVVFFNFLPDFLTLLFARTILRGNSSLSWWAAFLSEAKIYSPVVKPKPMDKKEKFYEMETEFVEGNHPHFMGNICEGEFNDIVFSAGVSTLGFENPDI